MAVYFTATPLYHSNV